VIEYQQNPTPEEAKFLRESQWITGMAKSPGWSLIKGEMQRMVECCRDLVDGCESSDAQIIAALHLRLKMTRSVVRDIVNWVETSEIRRKQLIEELGEPPAMEVDIPRNEFEEEYAND